MYIIYMYIVSYRKINHLDSKTLSRTAGQRTNRTAHTDSKQRTQVATAIL